MSTLGNITSKIGSNNVEDPCRSAGRLCREIMYLQDAITSIELYRKPFIAVGLPSIVGYANAMELALTGRRFTGVEANELGWNCLKVSSCCYWHKNRGYYVATWNSAMLISDDLKEAIAAHIQKRKPLIAKL